MWARALARHRGSRAAHRRTDPCHADCLRPNRCPIVIHGAGMAVHDAGYIFWDFGTGEVSAENGNHPVWNGEFDFSSLCSL
jgi:hypothetical protein